jgi:hypothetical protein
MNSAAKILLLAAVGLLLSAVYYALEWRAGSMPYGIQDPDVWMRLVRVWQWHDGAGWYDRMLPRLNAPDGLENHWTRPLDMWLAALAWPVSFFMPYRDALLFAAIVCNVPLALISIAALLSIGRTLNIGAAGQWMMALVLLTDGLIRSPYMVGRADHHSAVLACFVVMLALLARWDRNAAPRLLLAAGAVAGFGLWVSTEFLVAISLVAGLLVLDWMASGRAQGLAAAVRFLSAALAVALVGWLLEWPPSRLFTVTHIRISIVHVHILAVALAATVLLRVAARHASSTGGRLAVAAILGACALAWLGFMYPRFWEGPMADTPRELVPVFSKQLSELRPLYLIYDVLGVAGILISSALGISGYVLYLRQNRSDATVLRLFTVTLFYTLLMVVMVRWSSYALLVAVPAWGLLVDRLAAWIESRKSDFQITMKQTPFLAAITILLIVRNVFFLPASMSEPQARQKDDGGCKAALIRMLEKNQLPGEEPVTVLTHLDQAGQVMFWTPHAVIASNYNYNEEGIRDLDQFLFAQNEREAREVVQKRRAGLVLLCADGVARPFLPAEPEPEPLFVKELAAGKHPHWLAPAGAAHEGMIFLRVKTP